MPARGCRTIADTFNRRFAAGRGMTVGKTFAASLIRGHRLAILHARRNLLRSIIRAIKRNGKPTFLRTDNERCSAHTRSA